MRTEPVIMGFNVKANQSKGIMNNFGDAMSQLTEQGFDGIMLIQKFSIKKPMN